MGNRGEARWAGLWLRNSDFLLWPGAAADGSERGVELRVRLGCDFRMSRWNCLWWERSLGNRGVS